MSSRRIVTALVLLLLQCIGTSATAAADDRGRGDGGGVARSGDRPRDGDPEMDQHGSAADPVLSLMEALITDVQETPLVYAGAPVGTTCDWSNVRLTTPPNPGAAKKVAFVYITPTLSDTSWVDSRLDEARVCSNGNAYSAMDYMYRNISTFTANELNLSSVGAKRPSAFTNTHRWPCGPTTCTKSLYASYLLRTTNTYAYLSNIPAKDKLATVRTKLVAAGFNDPNVIYVAILHAQHNYDDPNTPADERDDLGRGWIGGVDTTDLKYAYGLRKSWNGASYEAERFGCASRGEGTLLHELSHVLGAVPATAPNINPTSPSHMNTSGDVMGPYQSFTLASTPNALVLDRGTEDYRSTAYNRVVTNAYLASGSSFVGGAYRKC